MDELVEAARHVPSLFSLDRKVAVLTGATGGIGNAIALALAAAGADLALIDLSEERLGSLAESIGSEFGREADPFAVDITDEARVAQVAGEIARKHGHIDILVNCAGVGTVAPALEMPLDQWRSLIRINLEGTFICCREVGRVMVAQESGKIINFSSVRGSQGRPGHCAYAPSKAGVNLLTKTLACEWAPRGINVNAIAPVFTYTAINAAVLDDPETRKAILARIPMGRLGQVWDLFGAVIFLASGASDFVTGTVLYVDGGWTAA